MKKGYEEKKRARREREGSACARPGSEVKLK